ELREGRLGDRPTGDAAATGPELDPCFPLTLADPYTGLDGLRSETEHALERIRHLPGIGVGQTQDLLFQRTARLSLGDRRLLAQFPLLHLLLFHLGLGDLGAHLDLGLEL